MCTLCSSCSHTRVPLLPPLRHARRVAGQNPGPEAMPGEPRALWVSGDPDTLLEASGHARPLRHHVEFQQTGGASRTPSGLRPRRPSPRCGSAPPMPCPRAPRPAPTTRLLPEGTRGAPRVGTHGPSTPLHQRPLSVAFPTGTGRHWVPGRPLCRGPFPVPFPVCLHSDRLSQALTGAQRPAGGLALSCRSAEKHLSSHEDN